MCANVITLPCILNEDVMCNVSRFCTVYTDLWFCLLLFVVVLHYYLLLYLVVTAVSAVILSSMSGDHLLRMRSVLARCCSVIWNYC